jgi:hypothetical protein
VTPLVCVRVCSPGRRQSARFLASAGRSARRLPTAPVWCLVAHRHADLRDIRRRTQVEVWSLVVEKIQRKSRVREWAPQKAPRIRAGVTKKDQKAELKYLLKKNQTHRCYAEKTSIFFPDDRQTPARREARNHRSEDAKMLGPPP